MRLRGTPDALRRKECRRASHAVHRGEALIAALSTPSAAARAARAPRRSSMLRSSRPDCTASPQTAGSGPKSYRTTSGPTS